MIDYTILFKSGQVIHVTAQSKDEALEHAMEQLALTASEARKLIERVLADKRRAGAISEAVK